MGLIGRVGAALVVVGMAVGGCTDDTGHAAAARSIPLPSQLAGEQRLVVPLGTVELGTQRPVSFTTGPERATLTLADGAVATFDRREVSPGERADSTPPIDPQSLGGIEFRRTLSVEAPGYGVGLLQTLEVVDHHGLDRDPATISSNGNGVGMDLDGPVPIEHVKFVRGGRWHWLTALPPGAHPAPKGADQLLTIADDLTGLRYALVVDRDGDGAATLRIPTSTGAIEAGFNDVAD